MPSNVPNGHSSFTAPRTNPSGFWDQLEDDDEEEGEELTESPIQVQHHQPEPSSAEEKPRKRTPSRSCARTILISNLSERASHVDVTNAIRGGPLIDIYLRQKDRSATVSFLYEEDSRAFFDHVRRHDLYICQKRVSRLYLP